MSPISRGLLALFSLISTLTYLVLITIMTGWKWPINYFSGIFANPNQRIIVIIVLIFLMLLSVAMFISSIQRKKVSRTLVEETYLGEVSITLNALENLVNRLVNKIRGVKEVEQKIIPQDEGIDVLIQAVVTPDIKIPEMANQIQELVQQQVFQITGITVKRVKVSVENITSDHKNKVE